MPASFVPTQEDIDRYLALRSAGKALNSKLVKTISDEVYFAMQDALGVPDSVLETGHYEVNAVMMDACLFDWYEDGQNLVKQYCESLPAVPRGDEGFLLLGYLAAQYRMLIPLSAIPGAGVHCRDAFTGDELFVMDTVLSRVPIGGFGALATRTIPLGKYSMGAGAPLPVDLNQKSLEVLLKYRREDAQLPREGARGVSILVAKSCFTAGFGSSLRTGSEDPPAKPRRGSSSRRKH